MTIIDKSTEYGVEVADRGYVDTFCGTVVVSENELTTTFVATLEEATSLAKRVVSAYTQMGCPEIAETIHIVERDVTVTRSDWRRV